LLPIRAKSEKEGENNNNNNNNNNHFPIPAQLRFCKNLDYKALQSREGAISTQSQASRRYLLQHLSQAL